MPQTPHTEKHFTSGEVVRDVVIGMSDGLTVPFALAAGLSGAVAASNIIVTAGLAEIVAVLIEWALFNSSDVPTMAEYVTGKSMTQREPQDAEPQEEIAPRAQRLPGMPMIVPGEAHGPQVIERGEGQRLALFVDERPVLGQRSELEILGAEVAAELQQHHDHQQPAPDSKACEVRRNPVAAAGGQTAPTRYSPAAAGRAR